MIPKADLRLIVSRLETELLQLKDARIVVSGASGFIGKWITSTLVEANQILNLNLSCLFLSGRTQVRHVFKEKKNFKEINLDFTQGVTQLDFGFTHAFHASTPSNINSGSSDSQKAQLVALNSMESLLNDAYDSKNVPNLIHLSSGSVYSNSHDFKLTPVSETFQLAKMNDTSSYTSTKLILEEKILTASLNGTLNGCNARLFAFYGPHLPVDAHFAIGNYMKNSVQKRPIQILGNPNTIRSYLHPVDLLILLFQILVNPKVRLINIGSKVPRTLLEVANTIADISEIKEIVAQNSQLPPSSYFPSVDLAQEQYNFTESVDFTESLLRWRNWLISQPRS